MKIIQEVTVDGKDLVLTIREADSNKVIGVRRWEGAAPYVATQQVYNKGKCFMLTIPITARLNIQ